MPLPRTTATASLAAISSASAAPACSASRSAQLFALQKASAAEPKANSKTEGGPGCGKAKSVILVYLQGGPSHLDLWDPKDNVPDNVRSVFKHRATKLPGVQFTELLPKLAKVNDKFTMIRSMSYTPNGLFNHTAAIYQMHDRLHDRQGQPVGPARAAERRRTSRTSARNIIRLKPPTVPMLPFVMLPRPLQESNVVGKGGTAGLPRQGVRSVLPLPDRRRHGHGQDGPHQASTT